MLLYAVREGRGEEKIKHRFTLVNTLRIKKESLKAGRGQCSLMCKANVTVKPPPPLVPAKNTHTCTNSLAISIERRAVWL